MRSCSCKCGKSEYFHSGMPPRECQGCDECNTQYGNHKERVPHKLIDRFSSSTGKKESEMCEVCCETVHHMKVVVSFPTMPERIDVFCNKWYSIERLANKAREQFELKPGDSAKLARIDESGDAIGIPSDLTLEKADIKNGEELELVLLGGGV